MYRDDPRLPAAVGEEIHRIAVERRELNLLHVEVRDGGDGRTR